jgi:hypothetical protein
MQLAFTTITELADMVFSLAAEVDKLNGIALPPDATYTSPYDK